eukprot:2445225-Amphidinium_carterae.1
MLLRGLPTELALEDPANHRTGSSTSLAHSRRCLERALRSAADMLVKLAEAVSEEGGLRRKMMQTHAQGSNP